VPHAPSRRCCPQVVSQVLQPCCLDMKALLTGGPGRKPVLVNTTEASVVAFQNALLQGATGTAVGAATGAHQQAAACGAHT
jgi:hypothetical protein